MMAVDDVIRLSQAGLSDNTIIAQIKMRPQHFDLSPDELLQLKSAHVSDKVIEAMVGATGAVDPSTATKSPDPQLPPSIDAYAKPQLLADGFYYKSPQGWQKLEPISMVGGGLKHVGKMFVPGLTPQMVWTFRDAESPAQFAEKRPTFCIRESPALANIAGRTGRDLLIVRFDKRKDRRELQTTNGGNMFTFKAGLSKDRMPDITTKTVADGIFLVTPNEDLKPGEYMVTFSSLGVSGYDFGVRQ
jgi:hypothetical protein